VRAAQVGLMLAETRERPFDDEGWLFEIKYDGFRALAEHHAGSGRLYFRGGGEATAVFPELAAALAALPADLVLDGEIVVADPHGHPSFQRLQQRGLLGNPAQIARAAAALPATLFAFDLLAFAGRDLRPLPLAERKALLELLLPATGPLRHVEHIATHGQAMYTAAARLGLEGIMAKRADSRYRAGRSRDWLKIRSDRVADLVIVGYTTPGGMRTGLGSLHLAAYRPSGLTYIGRAGSGLAEHDLARLPRELGRHVRPTPPCAGPLPRGPQHTWVEPRLVCEIRFREITHDGLLRQPTFLRLRPDKRPDECGWPEG
jgi:bifunctional non-homologous end joining protein LigD